MVKEHCMFGEESINGQCRWEVPNLDGWVTKNESRFSVMRGCG